MVSLAGLLIPFGLAILLEFRLKRVVCPDSLEQSANLPVIGEISRLTGSSHNSRSQRMFEESIDALCANLSFRLEGVRTITVTSAMPSEGKSSVASQLAIALAKACEEPVLLIDADIRLPGLHSLFGVEIAPGLMKVVRGEVAMDAAIDKSLGSLVHVLPAGRLSSNPHQLLSRKNVESLFAKIPGRYRYVVIDTAPVLPAAETLAIAAASDATLLCAMRDVTRSEQLKRAQSKLEAAGAKLLGLVFSGIPRAQYYHRYGNYEYAYRIPSHN
jgi:capsular exopolysaccharide synthesis family protein